MLSKGNDLFKLYVYGVNIILYSIILSKVNGIIKLYVYGANDF